MGNMMSGYDSGTGEVPPQQTLHKKSGDEPAVRMTSDIGYMPGSNHGKHRLNVYMPLDEDGCLTGEEQKSSPRPVVVHIHGGGWKRGSKDSWFYGAPSMGLGLARLPGRNGFVSVVPSYRLKTQHSDHVEDLTAVLRWVRDHIHAYGGDPSQIILSGHSAGGYLASFLGVSPNLLRERGLDPSVIKGVVCLSGIYWLPNPFDPDTKVSSGWYNSVFQRVYVRGTFGANMDRLRELSPLHRVASRKTADNAGTGAASTGQLPSFLVMNATSDLGLGVDGDRFHLALESAGTKVARHVLEGHDHATITRSKAALEVINNFLVGVLPARCSGA